MGRTVLIVDDNYICVEGIRHSIDWMGLGISEVHCEYDGSSAFEYLQKHPSDILISDISMPGMSGLELSEKALALFPSIKVLLISAYDEFEYAQQAVRLGAFDYIEKPLKYEYLTKILGKALDEMYQEEKNLEILRNSHPAIAEQFFRSLIQSGSSANRETLALYAKYLNLPLTLRFNSVISISVDDAAGLKQKLGIEEYYVRMMNVENALRTASEVFSLHFLIKDIHGYICILGDNLESRKAFRKKIHFSFQPVLDQFSSRCELVIGLGNIMDSIWELSVSYQSAEKALEYRFFFPNQQFLESNSISRYGHELVFGKDVPEENLIQCLSKNDWNGVEEWVQAFIHSFPGNCDSKIIVYSRLHTVIARLLKFSYELNITSQSFEKELSSVFSNPSQFKSITEISDWLLSVCRKISTSLQQSVTKYHESLCKSAVTYIQTHYKNSELGLNDIAENLQISPAYLSTLFKQCLGQNLSTFLTDTRIDAACNLLANTTIPLKSISSQVGYSNQYYFSSCFKKKMGMTPSLYREQNHQSNT